MKRFSIKPGVFFSHGALSILGSLSFDKAFILTDPFLVESGMLEKVTKELAHVPDHCVFTGIQPDPTTETIAKAMEALLASECRLIIAYGGGSTIDAAKSLIYYMLMMKRIQYREELYFVAIPTTSGTGSEMTNFSVVTLGNQKIPIVDDRMLPDMAILDPSFTESLPSKAIAETGVDVLTHAVEAFLSKEASYCSDALAEKVVKLVFSHLRQAKNHDVEGRTAMHHASCIAGMAFTNAGLGLNHAMAHALGGCFHIPHGLANALVFLPVMTYHSRHSEEMLGRYALLAGLKKN